MAQQNINMSKECKQARNAVVIAIVVLTTIITIVANI